jgi:hypothetical protein
LDVVVWEILVPTSVIVTFAPATMAPDESVTVPRISVWLIDWAKTSDEQQTIPNISPRKMANRLAFIAVPSKKNRKRNYMFLTYNSV